MEIKILGTGCKKCKKLYENVSNVVENEKLDANIEKIEDVEKIMEYGVMSTPALVIDGEVKSTGKLLKENKIKELLDL